MIGKRPVGLLLVIFYFFASSVVCFAGFYLWSEYWFVWVMLMPLFLSIAYGLLFYENWARRTAVYLLGFMFFAPVFFWGLYFLWVLGINLVSSPPIGIWTVFKPHFDDMDDLYDVLGSILSFAIWWYLIRSETKELFTANKANQHGPQ